MIINYKTKQFLFVTDPFLLYRHMKSDDISFTGDFWVLSQEIANWSNYCYSE